MLSSRSLGSITGPKRMNPNYNTPGQRLKLCVSEKFPNA
jgi:hypothetical protein